MTESAIGLLFLARNRLEFTRESFAALLANTNWDLVGKAWLYDDGSSDGTLEFLEEAVKKLPVKAELRRTRLGSPILVTNDFLWRSRGSQIIAKIDNDAIVPPRWLDTALEIMRNQPEVDCLGLEYRGLHGELPRRATATDHIGGLYVAHRRAFEHGELPVPVQTYFGWGDYQKRHGLGVYWINPSIPAFLLDRVPAEPWVSLSRKYEAKGWQRRVPAWDYRADQSDLWEWWTERKHATQKGSE